MSIYYTTKETLKQSGQVQKKIKLNELEQDAIESAKCDVSDWIAEIEKDKPNKDKIQQDAPVFFYIKNEKDSPKIAAFAYDSQLYINSRLNQGTFGFSAEATRFKQNALFNTFCQIFGADSEPIGFQGVEIDCQVSSLDNRKNPIKGNPDALPW